MRLYLPGRLHGGIARYPRVPCGKEHKGRGGGWGAGARRQPGTNPPNHPPQGEGKRYAGPGRGRQGH